MIVRLKYDEEIDFFGSLSSKKTSYLWFVNLDDEKIAIESRQRVTHMKFEYPFFHCRFLEKIEMILQIFCE